MRRIICTEYIDICNGSNLIVGYLIPGHGNEGNVSVVVCAGLVYQYVAVIADVGMGIYGSW